jgi:GDP-fucose transporter C1
LTFHSFNNLCLKYIDASFYQVARGLVLPLTVGLSWTVLGSHPSLRILLACAVVSSGFCVGIFLAGPSIYGMMFGFASSFTTALHAVVIKRSLDVVKGNTIELAWYSNTVSAIAMIPIFVLAGEIPQIRELFFGAGSIQQSSEAMSALNTFLYGSAITVR